MGDWQFQESFPASLTDKDALVQHLIGAVDTGPQYDLPGQERDEESDRRFRSLQEWICHLLIKNQQLRTSLLDSAATSIQGCERMKLSSESPRQ
jgi:hypothetical protein